MARYFIGVSPMARLSQSRRQGEEQGRRVGYQLAKVQRGAQPDDFKPMPSIGKGVEEI